MALDKDAERGGKRGAGRAGSFGACVYLYHDGCLSVKAFAVETAANIAKLLESKRNRKADIEC